MKKIAKKAIRILRNSWRFALGRDQISVREGLGHLFLKGSGIEIGALHNPMALPSSVTVQYVDRISNDDLLKHYPEMRSQKIVKVSMVTDAERLEAVPDGSQDFVIANHVLEHCQNPLLSIRNMLRVLRRDGRVFMAIPDMRYTFDKDRVSTSFDHILRDYEHGSSISRTDHYLEWTRDVMHLDGTLASAEADKLNREDYSIHFHAWTLQDLLQMLVNMQKLPDLACEVELVCRNSAENVVILRRT